MSRNTRILVIDDGPGVWGSQRVVLRLAPYFLEHGYELALLSNHQSEFGREWTRQQIGDSFSFRSRELALNAREESGSLTARQLTKVARTLISRSFEISRTGKEFRATVLLANSFWSHFDAALASQFCSASAVLYLHEICPPGLPARALRIAARLARTTIAVSTDVANSVNLPSKVRVITNGVDTLRFSPGPGSPIIRSELSRDPSQSLVIAICRLDEIKQVDHIIRAVASLSGLLANTHLAVVGAPTTDTAYARQLTELGAELLGDRVTFLAPRNDIEEVLRSADLYVLAGRLEGMPLGILEAQATGCPVVAYPAAGVRESVEHGVTGMLALSNDWQSLAENISTVLTSTSLHETLVSNGIEIANKNFSISRQARRMIEVLDSLA